MVHFTGLLENARHPAGGSYWGTLDPIATGLLPILIGEGTKFGSMSLHTNKIYNAEILLGVSTETGDREGAVVKKKMSSAVNQKS